METNIPTFIAICFSVVAFILGLSGYVTARQNYTELREMREVQILTLKREQLRIRQQMYENNIRSQQQ